MKAILALEDGNYFEGESFGAEKDGAGEVCFNTSMTGYQEILTDPSYAGQIVTLTYPEIGNYGINPEDVESKQIQVSGLVVKNCCEYPSNWRADEAKDKHPWSLSEYLKKNGIPGIMGIDTRRLTRILRETGAKNGVIMVGNVDVATALAKAKAVRPFGEFDFVRQVTIGKREEWHGRESALSFRPSPERQRKFTIAAIDYGAKYNILRKLETQGATVLRFPADAKAEEILACNPDGIFLSNGPGDPAVLDYAVDTIKALLPAGKPLFGICLGHQLLARSVGGKTFKLKFGHRGANHPVKDLRTGKVEITSQNHGYAVDPASLDSNAVEVTHINLNDKTVAGLRLKNSPAYSVQYHPEASPGPKDSHYLFEEFIAEIKKHAAHPVAAGR
ncbi:MAG: glutamine-hydrolyzing carbamoyl-phosphate synthase small subunit [Fibrobacteres bacterium]|nr:glutamine-hydrolyzing carbamoyl-phosphate synthase small subunit [Fibrobacterota bacterium]